MELQIDLESSKEYYDLKIPTPMELQIELESSQEYYDLYGESLVLGKI